jgi:predicted acyl esterase
VAQLDFHELRYAWFDHVLKGAPRPALLQDRVNFQVMGANQWRHASSLESMSADSMRLHLVPSPEGLWHGLAAEAPERETAVELTVDLADRADAGTTPSAVVLSDSLALDDQLAFASDPLPSAVEISGMVDGVLRLRVNKRDVDLSIRLYELTSSGSYLRLSIPYLQRASYLHDREQRELLMPNEVQELPFALRGPVSRRLEQGSRILLLVGVNKSTDAQVNYGTGKDVSDETIADAGEPLRIQWLSGSFVNLPMSR